MAPYAWHFTDSTFSLAWTRNNGWSCCWFFPHVAYSCSLLQLSVLFVYSHFICLAVHHVFGVLSNSFYVRSTETGMWWIDGTTIACCLHVNQSSLIIVLSKHSICFSFILSFYYPWMYMTNILEMKQKEIRKKYLLHRRSPCYCTHLRNMATYIASN